MRNASALHQAQHGAAHDLTFLCRRQLERAYLRQLDTGVEPGAVGAEDELVSSRAPSRGFQEIEPPDPRRIGVDIRVTHEMIDERQLGFPVVGKAAQVGNDERDGGILRRQQLHDRDFSHDVVDHRKPIGARDLADLPCDPPIVTMHLDSAESVLHHGGAYQGGDATSVALRVHEGETVKSIRSTANELLDGEGEWA